MLTCRQCGMRDAGCGIWGMRYGIWKIKDAITVNPKTKVIDILLCKHDLDNT